jgi:hypothetical protein
MVVTIEFSKAKTWCQPLCEKNFTLEDFLVYKMIYQETALPACQQMQSGLSHHFAEYTNLHNSNGVSIANGGETVGNHDGGAPMHASRQGLLNQTLALSIQCACCLPQ